MFMAERIDEDEGLGELFGADEKTAAIDFPFVNAFIHVRPPLELRDWLAGTACEFDWERRGVRTNLRAGGSEVNSITLVHFEKKESTSL
jgi:hypothetical protein